MSNEAKKLIAKLHPLERKVLPYTAQISSFHELVSVTGLQEVEVMRALQWLQNKGLLVLKETIQEIVELDKNGRLYLEKGLPEKRFLKALEGAAAIPVSAVQQNSGLDQNEMTICMGLLKRRNAITLKKEGNELLVSMTSEGQYIFKKPTEEELFLQSLAMPRDVTDISPAEKKIFAELSQRKSLVTTTVVKLKSVTLTALGHDVLTYDLNKEFVEQLTPEMLKAGSWKNHEFRHYDVSINVPAISGGKQHIVTQAISYIKHIWLDMGFVEMTGPLLQTSYWDLDSLFVPQDHPARQMQDTFFIKDDTGKAIALGKLPADFAKIKEIHECGATTGSTGWKTAWKEDEARKVLLRTHTTVLSALKLAELGQDPKILHKRLPLKFFNVGRVFRNEALDWKHLFEFHQVDGIVIYPDANMKNLKAYLRQFFGKMGYPKIRIRPAYFPYTEPSMEVEVWHPKKNQWVELGGAGIFRPEVVVPLLGADIPVLAWGLGLERIISEYYHLTDIRDLYKNDLKQLQQMKIWVK
jgi:phenylalanyl-tRNA synthetase alpha chain